MSEQLRQLSQMHLKGPEDEKRSTAVRVLSIVGIVLVISGAAFGAYRYLSRPEVSIVTTAEVIAGTPESVGVRLIATGYIEAKRRALVAAKAASRIARLFVEEGQEVQVGQAIAELDAGELAAGVSEARAAIGTTKARVTASRASLNDARLQLRREQTLFKSGSTGQAAVDAAQSRVNIATANMHEAQAEVSSANARLERAKLALANTQVTSPIAGRIVKRFATVGETLGSTSSGSSAIVEVVDFSSLFVEAEVSEAKISLLKVSDPALIRLDAFRDKRFSGRIEEIHSSVDRQKATILVRVRFLEAATGVLPQMAAKVYFLDSALADAKDLANSTFAPKRAVVTKDGRSRVFVVANGTAKAVDVSLGKDAGELVQILNGPPLGAHLIVDPPEALADGSVVQERSE